MVLLAGFVAVQVTLVWEAWPDTGDSSTLSAAVLVAVVALYVAVGWSVSSWWGVALALVPLLVGLPRIVVDPSDLAWIGLALGAEVAVLTALPICAGIAAAKIAGRTRPPRARRA